MSFANTIGQSVILDGAQVMKVSRTCQANLMNWSDKFHLVICPLSFTRCHSKLTLLIYSGGTDARTLFCLALAMFFIACL